MNEDCGSCGGHIGPSPDFPWHYENEDCRGIKQPYAVWNFVYSTPCGGKVTGVMRLVEGLPEMIPNANIPSGGRLSPALPTDQGWLAMEESLGSFESDEQFEQAMSERVGWSLTRA